jgi:hypothetical protein
MGGVAAYAPQSASAVAAIAGLCALAIVAGFAAPRLLEPWLGRIAGWTTLGLGTAAVERLARGEPAGVRMLALIAFALAAMKMVVAVEERARSGIRLQFGRWLAFALGWPGMQPRVFARRGDPLPGAGALLARGAVRLALGAALIALARIGWGAWRSPMIASALALAGISFVLHFGLCNLAAALWRARGIPCEPLFRNPLRSHSLAEFWSRRWNLAFSEMTALAVYRPLAARLGRGPALFAGFLLSGLLHEMAISLPVRAGFGLPLAYFALQGGLVLTERELARRGAPVHGRWGFLWTCLWLIGPLPLLFHVPFLRGVVWPLVRIPAASAG